MSGVIVVSGECRVFSTCRRSSPSHRRRRSPPCPVEVASTATSATAARMAERSAGRAALGTRSLHESGWYVISNDETSARAGPRAAREPPRRRRARVACGRSGCRPTSVGPLPSSERAAVAAARASVHAGAPALGQRRARARRGPGRAEIRVGRAVRAPEAVVGSPPSARPRDRCRGSRRSAAATPARSNWRLSPSVSRDHHAVPRSGREEVAGPMLRSASNVVATRASRGGGESMPRGRASRGVEDALVGARQEGAARGP